VIHCVGRPIAVDWALSKDRYQKAVEHSGTFTFDEVFVSFHYCCWQQLMFIVYIYIYIYISTHRFYGPTKGLNFKLCM